MQYLLKRRNPAGIPRSEGQRRGRVRIQYQVRYYPTQKQKAKRMDGYLGRGLREKLANHIVFNVKQRPQKICGRRARHGSPA
jgi:hypothetical protein